MPAMQHGAWHCERVTTVRGICGIVCEGDYANASVLSAAMARCTPRWPLRRTERRRDRLFIHFELLAANRPNEPTAVVPIVRLVRGGTDSGGSKMPDKSEREQTQSIAEQLLADRQPGDQVSFSTEAQSGSDHASSSHEQGVHTGSGEKNADGTVSSFMDVLIGQDEK